LLELWELGSGKELAEIVKALWSFEGLGWGEEVVWGEGYELELRFDSFLDQVVLFLLFLFLLLVLIFWLC
jgi:hypothetical protein